MHCYEHEMLCLALEAEIRALDPAARVDRLDVSDALAEQGVGSGSAGDLRTLAERLVRVVPLAA